MCVLAKNDARRTAVLAAVPVLAAAATWTALDFRRHTSDVTTEGDVPGLFRPLAPDSLATAWGVGRRNDGLRPRRHFSPTYQTNPTISRPRSDVAARRLSGHLWSPASSFHPSSPRLMRLARLCLRNFRCFGPEPTVVDFDRITALLGGNGSGKTAVLQALARLFGSTQTARTLTADDFHVPHGERRDGVSQRELVIEAHLEFPTLHDPAPTGVEAITSPLDAFDPTVPPFFEQMAVDVDGVMLCRIRLTGRWTRTSDPEGTVEIDLEWLRSARDEPPPEDRSRVSPTDRDRVRVHYVPASRDATRHLTASAGGLLQQLLRAIDWDDDVRDALHAAGERLRTVFSDHPAVTRLNAAAGTHWSELYDEWLYREPTLNVATRQIPELVRSAHMVFGPSHADSEHELDRLSDGQQSLFYFACIGTLFEIQRETYLAQRATASRADSAARALPDTTTSGRGVSARESIGIGDGTGAMPASPGNGFAYDRLRPADLTIFAIEEPENHLAPHYLGRIVARLTAVLEHGGAQVVLASHAPAVLARIEPQHVRHLRCDHLTHRARVRRLSLPDERTDAERYIREAVRAYPELYFARAVVLCEGDSEETILPRFARVLGTDLDLAFVSVVPLGGRHVNHFWRLLTGLGIPFVTLLDLDRERGSGGWARIRDVCRQLLAFADGTEQVRLLAGPPALGDMLSVADLDALGRRDPVVDVARLQAWVEHLRTFGVFFSAPLDLDFLMLEAFEAEYRATVEEVPRLDEMSAIVRVLGRTATGESYTAAQHALFPWYGYLFYGRGKPSTHTAAWIGLDSDRAHAGMPEPLRALFGHLQRELARPAQPPVSSAAQQASEVDDLLGSLAAEHGLPTLPVPMTGRGVTATTVGVRSVEPSPDRASAPAVTGVPGSAPAAGADAASTQLS